MERDNVPSDDTCDTHVNGAPQASMAYELIDQCCALTLPSHLVVDNDAVTTIYLFRSNSGARACRARRE